MITDKFRQASNFLGLISLQSCQSGGEINELIMVFEEWEYIQI